MCFDNFAFNNGSSDYFEKLDAVKAIRSKQIICLLFRFQIL
jgi:hypothetical protein